MGARTATSLPKVGDCMARREVPSMDASFRGCVVCGPGGGTHVGVVFGDGGTHVDQVVVHGRHLDLQIDLRLIGQSRLVGRRQALLEMPLINTQTHAHHHHHTTQLHTQVCPHTYRDGVEETLHVALLGEN